MKLSFNEHLEKFASISLDLSTLKSEQLRINHIVKECLFKELHYGESFDTESIQSVDEFDIILKIIFILDSKLNSIGSSNIQIPTHLKGYMDLIDSWYFKSHINEDINDIKKSLDELDTESAFLF